MSARLSRSRRSRRSGVSGSSVVHCTCAWPPRLAVGRGELEIVGGHVDRALVREVNRNIFETLSRFHARGDFLCECESPGCRSPWINLSTAAFAEVLEEGDCWIVGASHAGEGGTVVREGDGYLVIRAGTIHV